jgi:hypothetical protein
MSEGQRRSAVTRKELQEILDLNLENVATFTKRKKAAWWIYWTCNKFCL